MVRHIASKSFCYNHEVAFSDDFLEETVSILSKIDRNNIEKIAQVIQNIRENNGRLFILGVGGSAGHAGHAVNDFRKICGVECYAPTDNVSELTARANDEGWDTIFSEWLKVSRLSMKDGLLIFSVGGGDATRNVSPNLVRAIDLAKDVGAVVCGIVGRDGGYTARMGDAVVVIPPIFENRITPHTEGICAVIWHLLVSHPLLQMKTTMWESVAKK
jgi:D-sedoheptulose 7-phosphate isomerase